MRSTSPRLRRAASWAALGIVLVTVMAVGVSRSGPPGPEARARRLESAIRCPTCRAQSSLESNAPIAQVIRTEIERRVQAGESDRTIRAYMVSRYGDGVLLDPKVSGASALVWLLPLLAFVLGAAGLAVAFWRWAARAGDDRPSEEDQVLVRRARRDSDRATKLSRGPGEQAAFLLGALADLEAERGSGDLDEAAFVALHDDMTARAAVALRTGARPTTPAPRTPAPSGMRLHLPPRRRRVVIGGGLAAGALVVGVLVAGAATGRGAGQTVTGSLPGSNAAKLAEAVSLVHQGQGLSALRYFKEVLDQDPANAEALAYRGLAIAMTGRAEPALADLDRAIAADPAYPDPHYFRGMVLSNLMGDAAGGAEEFQRALALHPAPDIAARIQAALQGLQTAGPPTPSGAGG